VTGAAPGLATAGITAYLTTGAGRPVTAFVHGLTGSVAETRPFGSGVPGTRVFPHLRGHGGTGVPTSARGRAQPGSWADLAVDVRAVLAATGANRVLGVSAGAGVVLRLLADAARSAPGDTDDAEDARVAGGTAIERAVLALPAASVLGAPMPREVLARYDAMAEAVEAGDVEGLAGLLRTHQPERVRRLPAVGVWSRRRAADLVRTPVSHVLRAWPRLGAPVEPTALGMIGTAVLVLAHEDDDVHPLAVARALAQALPAGTLCVLPPGGVPWCARDRMREVISDFLAQSGSRAAGVYA
jgi:hypothetical protein